MSDVAHTPLPWGIGLGFDLGNGASAKYVAGPDPEAVGIKLSTPWIEGAWDDDEEAAANAEFIVRACNSHYELCEALERLVDSDPDTFVHSAAISLGRAALARARGQS